MNSKKDPPYSRFDSAMVVDLAPHYDGGSGGPPGGPELETRVKRLEDDMKEIKGDLKTLVKDIAEMKGRLSAMPTTWQLIGMVLAIMGATFAFIRFGLTGV